VASDFKDLFPEDWRPGDFSEGSEAGSGIQPFDAASSDSQNLSAEGHDSRPGGFTSENENRKPRSLNEKEVKVMGVYIQQEQGLQAQHFVLFRDNRGRLVRIWVGPAEAVSISNAIENEPMDRPLTHDLMKIFLDKLGASVERVIIDDLWKETFYAKITLVKPNGEISDIDARPSDAVAIGLRMKAPIYMAENVLEQSVRPE
jgi:bifunctional DNase/RNase